MIEDLREAMVGALHEIAASSSTVNLANFIDVVKSIREDLVLTYMSDLYVTTHVWPMVRKDIDLTKSVLSATANFCSSIDDLGATINKFSNRVVCFTAQSAIVDDDLLGKSVSQKDLEKTLLNNNWLFFLLFCSIHLYLVIQVGSQYIPEAANAKTNPS